MSGKSSSVFPLMDRPSPILDRIRNRGTAYSTGKKLGELIIKTVQSENYSEKAQKAEDFMDGILDGMSDESEQPTDTLNKDLPEELAHVLSEIEAADVFAGEDGMHTLSEFDPQENLDDTDNDSTGDADSDSLPSEEDTDEEE